MPRILIIEDESSIADTIIYALETENFETQWVKTGTEGIEKSKNGIDLVVLDIGLPDITGFEVCREIRKDSRLPILFLTARDSETDKVLGLELGGDDYLTKPFSPRELTARVKAILRRYNFTEEDAAWLPFRIDDNKRTVRYFDTALDLTRYEYNILSLMIGRPGWVYTRAQLMQEAWDEPDESYDRTVDTHIKTLRAKLDSVRPGEKVIITHRGNGYSLREDW